MHNVDYIDKKRVLYVPRISSQRVRVPPRTILTPDTHSTHDFKRYKPEYILLTKTTAAQNEDTFSYHKVRGLYFLAVVFVRSIVIVTLSISLNSHLSAKV